MSETQPPAHYEITVEGILDLHWSAWFDGLQLASDGGRTILTGPVADQGALHGLLAKIRDLGLPMLAVRRTEPPLPVPNTPQPGGTAGPLAAAKPTGLTR